ncbi:MAG TPA: Na-translocating system protein MpsC family protein [Gemmataceae bacterium]|nr:Na-translocating system protein MpsC family protein [Gemmataceae bacterium]
MIRHATGADVVSLHHDISTVTGEEVILFTLNQAPAVREQKKR